MVAPAIDMVVSDEKRSVPAEGVAMAMRMFAEKNGKGMGKVQYITNGAIHSMTHALLAAETAEKEAAKEKSTGKVRYGIRKWARYERVTDDKAKVDAELEQVLSPLSLCLFALN